MFEKYSEKARFAIFHAREETSKFGTPRIGCLEFCEKRILSPQDCSSIGALISRAHAG